MSNSYSPLRQMDMSKVILPLSCTYSSRTSSSSLIGSSLKFTDIIIHLHSRDTRAMASFGSSWSFARSRGEFLTNQLNISWQQRNSTLANHFKNVVFRTAQLGFWEWRLDFIWLWTGFLQTYFVKKQVTGISRGLFQFPANYYHPRYLPEKANYTGATTPTTLRAFSLKKVKALLILTSAIGETLYYILSVIFIFIHKQVCWPNNTWF